MEDGRDGVLEMALRSSLISGARFGSNDEKGTLLMSSSPAERLAFTISLAELSDGPREFLVGPLGRKVTASFAPVDGGSERAKLTFTDASPGPGINPYWVKVVQTDMEMAWSTPVFVDYLAGS